MNSTTRVKKNDERNNRLACIRLSIFSVLLLSYILVYFHRMAPGVVSEDLLAAFTISGTQLGTLSSIYFMVYALMQLPSGVIADTLGTRVSVISGNLVAGGGSIVFGLAPDFTVACLGRFLVGLGVSVVFVSIMKNNSVWFHERFFALLSGVTLLVGNLGSVLAAGPLASILTLFAWRSVFVAIGCVSLSLAVVGWLVIANKPEDLGLDPPNSYVRNRQTSATRWWLKLAAVVSTMRLWPGFWVQFGMVGSLYSFMGLWGVRYLQDVHGIDRGFAASHMTVMLLSFAAGSLFWGWYSDRICRRKPILVGCVAGYLVTWLMLIFLPWQAGIEGYLLFGGMGFMGAGFVATFAAAKEVIDPDLSGMAVSVVNTGCFAGTALMQPVFGMIMDSSWNGTMSGTVRIYSSTDYYMAFLLVLAFCSIAVVGALRIHETRAKNSVAENRG